MEEPIVNFDNIESKPSLSALSILDQNIIATVGDAINLNGGLGNLSELDSVSYLNIINIYNKLIIKNDLLEINEKCYNSEIPWWIGIDPEKSYASTQAIKYSDLGIYATDSKATYYSIKTGDSISFCPKWDKNAAVTIYIEAKVFPIGLDSNGSLLSIRSASFVGDLWSGDDFIDTIVLDSNGTDNTILTGSYGDDAFFPINCDGDIKIDGITVNINWYSPSGTPFRDAPQTMNVTVSLVVN